MPMSWDCDSLDILIQLSSHGMISNFYFIALFGLQLRIYPLKVMKVNPRWAYVVAFC